MITRRRFLETSAVTASTVAAGLVLTSRGWMVNRAVAAAALLDAASHPKFINPMPMPPRIDTNKNTGEIRATTQWLGLVDSNGNILNTEVWGYKFGNAQTSYPGATLIAKNDVPKKVKWSNVLPGQAHLIPVDTSIHRAVPARGLPAVTHLHGGHTESASDGLPEAWFTKNFKETGPTFVKKTYRYDNDQRSATLWYHDHTLGMTRLNVYAGLAGFYLLRDKFENLLIQLGVLPSGSYEKEIVIQDRMFTADGQLFLPSDNPEIEPINPLTGEPFPPLPGGPSIIAEFFGNFILVNGMAWPVLDVEPRKYRFRLLNGSDSRFYLLKLGNNMPFLQIGADQGFLVWPVSVNELLIAPGERVDLILDFNGMENTEITLKNIGPDNPFKGFDANGNVIGGPADPATTGQIMKLRVNQLFARANGVPDASIEPNMRLLSSDQLLPNDQLQSGRQLAPDRRLAPDRQFLEDLPDKIRSSGQSLVTRKLVLFEGLDNFGRLQPLQGTLNKGSLAWFEPITENPGLNNWEVWEVYNTTEDAHPIHIHLVAFLIINRESFSGTVQERRQPQHDGSEGVGGVLLADSIVLGNDARPAEPNERGWKDVMVALPGEVTRVITSRFDRPGRYVWHCHILSHEDHEMMRPYNVL